MYVAKIYIRLNVKDGLFCINFDKSKSIVNPMERKN